MSIKITNPTKASLNIKASLSIDVQATHLPDSNPIHPLESLYKKSELQESKPSFKFFPTESEKDDSDIEQTQVTSTRRSRVQSPLTPYTKRDFESRIIRSPAPTPDTAYNNKHFIWPTDKDASSDSEEDQTEQNNDSELRTIACERGFGVTDVRENDAKEKINTHNDNGLQNNDNQSDFQKWFWANQGQINRGWKRRRKLVMKEQRQKDKSKKASK